MSRFLKTLFFQILLVFTFSLSASAAPKCELKLDNFNDYKSSLISCLEKNINEFDKELLNDLSDNETNFFSEKSLNKERLVVNQKLILSEEFDEYLKGTVNKNYLNIYGIHQELNILKTNYNVSNNKLDKLISNSLADFSNSILETNNYNQNQIIAAAATGMLVAVLESSSKDSDTINFSLSASSSAENSGDTITLTATSTKPVNTDTVITLTTTGEPINNTDFALSSSTLTISSGGTTGSITFTITDDSVYEGNETISFSTSDIAGDSNFTSANPSIDFTIIENESVPVITMNFNNCTSFTAISTTVEEDASGTFCITTFTSQIADDDITVNVSLGGTASTSDYSSDYLSRGYITIDANSTQSSFSFSPAADSINEQNETLIVSISSVSGADATESGTQSETITITDTTTNPTITITADSSSRSETSSNPFTITATSSAKTYEDVIISLSISGTSTEGTDFETISDITIAAQNTTGTSSFSMIDDSIYEGSETIIIDISGVSGGQASESGTQQITLTINDGGESAPTVSLSSSGTTVFDNGSDITFTATSTQIADEDITVSISDHTGTATPGTDFGAITEITITAGQTEGTAAFNPTSDTVNEGSETAIIEISGVSGADATTSGTTSITITITEYALRTATAFTEGSASDQNAIKAETQWTNVDASSNDVHPYELMNIHKVQSFSDGTDNLTGKGEYIHIADFNCDDNHLVYSNKTIVNLDDGGAGESTFGNANSSNYHCQFVASMAAGDGTGNGDGAGENLVSGVAPDADLILSSIPNYSGNSADDYARDLDSARSYGAVASNNSWVFGDSTDGNANANVNITEAQADITTNGWTNIQGLAYLMHSSTNSQSVTDAQLYIDALNNFQNNGVIVFANGNYNGESDASVMAGLPEFFSQLEEAWITVNLSDFTGSDLSSATESDFTLHGNKCGQAAEYCLTADGYELNGGGYISGGTHYYPTGSGSSYSAPMVSGGIALLAQAFPNHTPEQLTDRVFASANNSWFTPEGNVTFTSHGNSITHGYHTTWGHGVPDFYAALSPITTNSNPASFIIASSLAEGYTNQSERFTLSNSSLAVSSMIGSSLVDSIKGTSAYFYDALGGGFEYDLSNIVYSKSDTSSQELTMNDELAHLQNFENEINLSTLPKYYSGEYFNFKNENDEGISFTITSPSVAMQKLQLNQSKKYNDDDFTNLKGLGMNNTFRFEDYEFTLSLLDTSLDPILIDQDHAQSLVGSFSLFTDANDKNLTLSVGHIIEKDTLLFSKGSSGLNLGNEDTNSNIFAANYEKIINDNHIISLNALFSKTEAKKFNNSLISGTDKLISSKFDINYSINNIFDKNNSIQFSLSQPTYIEQGSMSFRLPGLADTDGNIPFNDVTISLKPSARQLDYQIGYYSQFNEFVKFGFRASVGQNQNHDPNASLSKDLMSSIFINF